MAGFRHLEWEFYTSEAMKSSAEVWILRDRPSCCSRWPIDRHERHAPENETGKSILISHEMGLTLYAD
jgi:hypothetical protein